MKTDILGIRFDDLTREEAAQAGAGLLRSGSFHYVVTPNPEFILSSEKDPEFRRILNEADLVLPDGIGVVYSAKILGTPLKERVPGIDFAADMLAQLNEMGGRLFLLGAKPGVAEEAGSRICTQYPNLVLCGTHDGYFDNEAPVVRAVSQAAPDLLFVCLGAPKQEKWMARWGALTGAKLAIGLGGALDVFAGNVDRAPEKWRRMGLEWAYRLSREPKRHRPDGQAASGTDQISGGPPPGQGGPELMPGKLIVFEGTDGSGKSTQFQALCARVEQTGTPFRRLVFPQYQEPSSALIRMYLGGEFGSRPGDVNPYAASAFYAVDRYASLKKVWGEYYSQGGLILTDRYTTSNAVHQGAKCAPQERPAFLGWLDDFEHDKLGLPRADLVLYLDMPTRCSLELLRSREAATHTQGDIHEVDPDYLAACRDSALQAARLLGWQVIPCVTGDGRLRTVEEIHREVWSLVSPLLNLN